MLKEKDPLMDCGTADIFLNRMSLFKLYAPYCTYVYSFRNDKSPISDCLFISQQPYQNTAEVRFLYSTLSFPPRFFRGTYLKLQRMSDTILLFHVFLFPSHIFPKECFKLPECRYLGLDSFLCAPLQRMTKYPLLLRVLSNFHYYSLSSFCWVN